MEAWDRDQKIRLAQGRVSTTDNAIDVATSTLRLKATLDNRDGSLFPNQFAHIRLQLDTLKNVLAVPAQAATIPLVTAAGGAEQDLGRHVTIGCRLPQ